MSVSCCPLSPCCHRLSTLTWPRSYMREWTGCPFTFVATTSTSRPTSFYCLHMLRYGFLFCGVQYYYLCMWIYVLSEYIWSLPSTWLFETPLVDGKHIHVEGYRQLYYTADIDNFCIVMFWHSRIVFIWSLQKFTSLVLSFKTLGSCFQPNFRN